MLFMKGLMATNMDWSSLYYVFLDTNIECILGNDLDLKHLSWKQSYAAPSGN